MFDMAGKTKRSKWQAYLDAGITKDQAMAKYVEKYDELKNKLKVEHFSGYSDITIQQDLYCAVFISNLQSVIVGGLKDELEVINEGRQYDYKVNTNLSYGFLKNRVLELLYQKAPLDKVFQELEELFLKHTIPIRKNRKNQRDTQKYRYKDKPFITKNQKDSL